MRYIILTAMLLFAAPANANLWKCDLESDSRDEPVIHATSLYFYNFPNPGKNWLVSEYMVRHYWTISNFALVKMEDFTMVPGQTVRYDGWKYPIYTTFNFPKVTEVRMSPDPVIWNWICVEL